MVLRSSEQSLQRKRPRLKRFTSVLGWGLFVAAAILIWPAALGGSTSYVVVTGESMEPTLYAGDLVVLRKGTYEVGDVVAYEPFEDSGAQVIHRILEFKDDGAIILQGDNNDFIDPFEPTVEAVNGKMVWSVPKVGRVTVWLGQPLVWGSLLVIAAALLLYQGSGSNEKDKHNPDDQSEQGGED